MISAAAFPLMFLSRRKSHNEVKGEWGAHRLLIDALIDVIIFFPYTLNSCGGNFAPFLHHCFVEGRLS